MHRPAIFGQRKTTTEYFYGPEERLSKTARKCSCLVWSSVHARFNAARVLHKDGKFTVSVAQEASIIDVCRSDYHVTVIDDHKFTVYIDKLSHLKAVQKNFSLRTEIVTHKVILG